MRLNFSPEKSLSTRLMLYTCIFTYLLLVGFWSVLFFSLKQSLEVQDENLVKDRLQTIISLLQSENGPSASLSRRIENEWFERNSERILVRVLNSERKMVTETPHMSDEYETVLKSIEDENAINTGKPKLTRFENDSKIYETAVAETWVGTQPPENFRIAIALERTGEQTLLSRFRVFFFYLLAIGGIASLWIGRRVVKVALAPVREVSTIAARINSDRLGERIEPSNLPVEFHELASTMNGMLNRLSDSFMRLTRFSDDMAHELRTPVNNLLGTMEVALAKDRTVEEYKNIIGSGIEECERLRRIIESLLFIARSADPNQSLEKQTMNLEEELKSIVSFYEASADEKEIHLILACDPGLQIQADRNHLQRCIGNLVSNSIRHSSEKSDIEIEALKEPGFLTIRVIDHGSGIPAAAMSRIGERFFRADPSRSKLYGGTGLGISIARSIAELHGGSMTIDSVELKGTTVILKFPILVEPLLSLS